MIAPARRPDFTGIRIADPMPVRESTNSTGVAQEQPPSSSQGMAQEGGGGVLVWLISVAILVAAFIYLMRVAPWGDEG